MIRDGGPFHSEKTPATHDHDAGSAEILTRACFAPELRARERQRRIEGIRSS